MSTIPPGPPCPGFKRNCAPDANGPENTPREGMSVGEPSARDELPYAAFVPELSWAEDRPAAEQGSHKNASPLLCKPRLLG